MILPRVHLAELEDSARLPRLLRDMMTEYLRWIMDTAGPYDRAAHMLAQLLRQAGTRDVVDLASGGAGPWVRLLPLLATELDGPLRVTLTELYPNLGAFARAERESRGQIRGYPSPVNAAAVPPSFRGLRTIFTGLHHLRPEQVRALLRDTAAHRQAFAAFELTERSIIGVLAMFATVGLVLVSAPLIRPFRLERLLLTWLIPVLPVCIVWDGVASALRSYTREELHALAIDAAPHGYVWEAGQFSSGLPLPVSYLIGRPAA